MPQHLQDSAAGSNLQAAFLHAKAYTAALQAAAVDLQGKGVTLSASERRKTLVCVLAALQRFHRLIKCVLVKAVTQKTDQHASVEDSTSKPQTCSQCCCCGQMHCWTTVGPAEQLQAAANCFAKELRVWRDALPSSVAQLLSVEQAAVDQFVSERQRHLQAETAANKAAATALGLDEQACSSLEQLVSQLRSIESCAVFQGQLLQQASAMAQGTGYSSDNFAYSSTPFSSWVKVQTQPQVAAAISAAMSHLTADGRPATYMVWGSSTGWLALYAALAYAAHSSWHVVGVELLPGLVQLAQHLAVSAGLNGVEFVCGDLLASDLSNVGVLLLTEQCWDKQLIDKAACKIQKELPGGSVVIDYLGSMAKAGLQCSLHFTVEVAVGWNAHQVMHVYTKAAES